MRMRTCTTHRSAAQDLLGEDWGGDSAHAAAAAAAAAVGPGDMPVRNDAHGGAFDAWARPV